MAISSVFFRNHTPYDTPSARADPYSIDRVPRDVPLIEDFRITPPDAILCSLLGVKTVVIKKGTVLNAEGTGWGFLAYDISGKIAPALYTGPIEKYEPHGYGSIHFSDGLGQYDGPFTHGIPGGFGVHKTSAGVMRRIGEIRFVVSEGSMEFVLHGIGEHRDKNCLKAGFFENDVSEGPGMILTTDEVRAVFFANNVILKVFAPQPTALPSFSFAFSFALNKLQEKPVHPTPVIAYLNDVPSAPPSGIPLASPLIIKSQQTQEEIFRFPKGSILIGFDAAGNTKTWGSCYVPETMGCWTRLESQFRHFEPYGYGRKYFFDEKGNLERIEEGAFGRDPSSNTHFSLQGFGRIMNQDGTLIQAGFFHYSTLLSGPALRILIRSEKEALPEATMIQAFFDQGLPTGPAIFCAANGAVMRKGFYTTMDGGGARWLPVS